MNSHKLTEHRNKITECIKSNAFDGAQLKAMQKHTFASLVGRYCDDQKLDGDSARLHTSILKFDFATLKKPLARLNQNEFYEWVVECAQNIAPDKAVQIIKNLIIKKGLNGNKLIEYIKMAIANYPSNPSVLEDFMHNALVCDGANKSATKSENKKRNHPTKKRNHQWRIVG
eukprot:818401_1